jgi:lipoprotein signal peptidase
MEGEVPKALSIWFIIHFIIDLSIAIPLFFFPERTLELFGWENVDILMSRVVAAALFGIGIESLIGRKASLDGFKNMLNLKIIWSFTASAGIAWSMIAGAQGRPLMGWIVLTFFIIFHVVWWYWRIQVGKMLKAPS